jgi:hypothetical protein
LTSVVRSSSRSTLQAFITFGVGFVDQRQQQVLQRCKLVPARIGIRQRRVNGLLKCVRK